MTLFKKYDNTQAYLKMGILGFAGSGKTATASNIAAGLTLYQMKNNISKNNKIFFIDTETGSDFLKGKIEQHGLELSCAKTRAFIDLLTAVDEAEKNASVLIIDSITHFWKELIEAYQKKKKRNFISMQDWGLLKKEWSRFMDKYINSNLHIIMCGRAGYEYDYFEDENDRKQLEKSGIRMKSETESGYEASLLVYMKRAQELEGQNVKQWREAHIWKDRTDTIDGHCIVNPTFKDFLPHLKKLNLGGEQLGVDTSQSSEGMFESPQSSASVYFHQKKIALEELKSSLDLFYSTSREDKKKRIEFLTENFGTSSQTAIEDLSLEVIKKANEKLLALSQPSPLPDEKEKKKVIHVDSKEEMEKISLPAQIRYTTLEFIQKTPQKVDEFIGRLEDKYILEENDRSYFQQMAQQYADTAAIDPAVMAEKNNTVVV